MKIKMAQVIDEKITNIKVRKSFNKVDTIEQTICKCKLKFIRRIIRMNVKKHTETTNEVALPETETTFPGLLKRNLPHHLSEHKQRKKKR